VEPPPPRRAFQLLPYIGLHSYQGEGGAILGPGLRLGALLGFRVGDNFWIDGELTIDSLNASNLPVDDSYSEDAAAIGLSPLFMIPAGDIELLFGPKLGVWGARYFQTSLKRGEGNGSYSGFDLGANGAVLFSIGRAMWLGGLASFDVRSYSNSCFSPAGGVERCASGGGLPSSDKIVAFSVVLMISS
jgi:hypothetical protein